MIAEHVDKYLSEHLGSYAVVSLRAWGYTLKIVPELGGQVIALEKGGISALSEPATQKELQAASTSFGLPILFPPNRIDGGHFKTDTREYQFPVNETARGNSLHGFLHTRPWSVTEIQSGGIDGEYVGLEYEADETTDFFQAYPHVFCAKMGYSLSPSGLEQTVTIENRGKEPMPIGLGFHSAFIVNNETRIRASVGKRILMNERMLPTGEVRELNEEEKRLRAEGLPAKAWSMDDHYTAEPIEYEGMPFHGAVIERSDAVIVYEVDEFYQHWMIWNAGGQKDLICIEPQNWRVNAPNLVSQGMSRQEAGFMLLAPGESFSTDSRIQIKPKA